jgi:hypothetical protein
MECSWDVYTILIQRRKLDRLTVATRTKLLCQAKKEGGLPSYL